MIDVYIKIYGFEVNKKYRVGKMLIRVCIYIYIYIYIYISSSHTNSIDYLDSLSLSCHPSLLFIALGRSSRWHPVSSQW